MPPEDDVLPVEEQPLPAAVSPTADSPGYILESDPEENPEKDDDEDHEEDPTNYPTDRDDDEEEEPFRDEADDEEEGEDDEEEEEEHPALADSIPPPPVHHTTTRISIPAYAPVPFLSKEEVNRFLAIPTPPPSLLTPLSSPLPHIPSPPLPVSPPLLVSSPPPPVSPTYPGPLLPIPLPTPSPPLLLPSTDCRVGVSEVTLPPQKRLCITLGLRYKVSESSSALTARPSGGFRADYRFVATLDDKIRRDPESDVGYRITNTWDEMLVGMPGAPATDDTELGRRMTNFITNVRQDTDEIYGRLDKAQDARAVLSGRLNLLQKDRCSHAYTALLMEREARLSREAWGRSITASDTTRSKVMALRTIVLAQQHVMLREANGKDSHDSGTSVRRQAPPARECTCPDFMKCKPLYFKGTDGVVELTQWFERMETMFRISNCSMENQIKFFTCTFLGSALTWWNSHVKTIGHDVAYAKTWTNLKKKMTDKYCPRGEIKKLEVELWNLKAKGMVMIMKKTRSPSVISSIDVHATNIVLQGLPKDIYKLINHNIEAKAIWDNVKMLLAGSELTKEDRESQLYDEFERFKMLPGENINEYYVRFHKLVNNMRNIRMTMPNIQLNSKFVNNMSPEWDRFVTAVKLNKGLKETNHEQLYAYLKQHEKHAAQDRLIIERITPATNDQLAFVSTVQPHAQSSHVQSHQYPSSSTNHQSLQYPQFPKTSQIVLVTPLLTEILDNQPKPNGTSCPIISDAYTSSRTINFEPLLTPEIKQPFKMVGLSFRMFKGDRIRGQGKLVKCYNCNGIRHIARNYTQPKRPHNSDYFKDKMLLMQAQENGAVLDEEELLFLAGEQVNTFDADVDNQPVQDLALNEDNIFQADKCDAFDSDVDDEPTAQSIFMANLSSAGSANPQAGPSNASILSEVHILENVIDHSVTNLDEHEIHNEVQQANVIDSTSVDMGNSNVIPYEQYLSVDNISVVPSCASSALNDVCVLSDNYAFIPHDPIATELKIYKEQVAIYEQRAKFELTEREQRMDDQMRMLIQNRNKTEENLKKELHSVKLQLNSTMENNKIFEETVYVQKTKTALGAQNPFYLRQAKKAQPALYDGEELLKTNHVPVIVPSSEEDLELAETSRNKMHAKMNDSACVEKRVNITPPNYSKENFMATFTPQTQLTPEQVFWSMDLEKRKAEELKANAPPLPVLPPATVYPPNTPVHLVPRTLPTTSQVNIGLYVITQLFWDFEKTCKKRITPTGITEGERGFEQTKRCYLTEVIPFFNLLKEQFDEVQKSLVTEVRAMKVVFENLEAEVDQNEIDLKSGEIERKNLLITNENLIAECLSKDVFYTATDFVLNVSRFSDMHDAFTIAQKRIADLESENFNLRNKIQNDDHDSMIKHFSKLEVEHFNYN
ncbi:integrase, catalytic region, zinc finger, CCHC-type containing protein [Tanacetum coccineum]